MAALGASGPVAASGTLPPEAAGAPVMLARPLLGLSKARLAAVTREAGLDAVDDPSNRDPRFARARLRGLAAEQAALGLTPARMAKLAGRAARAEDALAAIAMQRFDALAGGGERQASLSADLWREPEEIALRVLALAVVRVIGPGGGHLSLERLERLALALRQARESASGLRRTFHGAVVRLAPGGEIDIRREPPRRRGAGKRAGEAGD